MAVKWKTKTNKLPDMKKRAESLNGRAVEVGCIDGDHAWLAGIHEYGCNIKVTPKMRAYLHSKGLHLSSSTTEIHIPERAFLRTGHDKNIKDVLQKTNLVVGQVIGGKMTEQQLFDLVGQMLSGKIKTYARDLRKPPNHPFTVAQKDSSNPLVDTGQMIEGISWRVK